ncbi:MAG TPA: ribosome biogenesis GTPase Der [candidate division Zixibacteria bacterium]|nr:ribosome biogenesis GTPase Der [candidate division Zixibacteria bacterium]MDD4917125.1 ribosome biogenesis GTPase Der [candidate division Zixibacteria bacterium]MDM7972691.1 ribosome biogenesis GTPase Der [candidate division Zixibacteria bacterium]HOD65394.1 ribosome biogenesis GTPase Der [candidate division Zixibacteria bacterium]HOZ08441.1 ribosome biogenesis GTPase Der [candidate division Zixibacteria bacterium]
MKLPTVAIVGRPNVGKSSLFNRFLRKYLAVVDETPGVTRDRNYAVCDWAGREFRLIDTGGLVPKSGDLMNRLIYEQADFAIHEADLVLLVVDAMVGADYIDEEIARRLQQSAKPTILVANKADNPRLELEVYDFLRLGLGEPMAVSATVGRGIGELLDKIVALLPEAPADDVGGSGAVRVAVVGRPNVGKSSFINKLTGEERAIVTPIAGTTRDAVDTPFSFEGRNYILVDTAGLRRKFKVHEDIEFYTTLRTSRAIDSAEVAVVLIDAQDGVTSQDQRILEDVVETRCAAVLAVNKWDLIEKETGTAERFARQINEALAHYSYLPLVFISALTGQRVGKVLALVDQVHAENTRQLPTPELNDWLAEVTARRHPPARQGKHIKFNYITQTGAAPPSFVIFANYPKLVDRSYVNYLHNQLRERWGFAGVSLRLKFRRK